MAALRRLMLQAFGRLPRDARRFIVRRVAPAWTAGAVSIIERDDGRWLMVKPVYREGWSLPGGIIDRGEHPATAAVREVREELGLRIRVEDDPWVVINPATRQIETVFRAVLLDDVDLDAITVRSYELEAVGWYPPDAPPALDTEVENVVGVILQAGMDGARVLIR